MSASLLRAAPLTLLSLALLSGPTEAQEYAGPVWGGSGGVSSYNFDCGSSGVMTGLFGKAGVWIDQIGLICRKVNTDGSLGSEYTKGPLGGSGGAGTTKKCPGGSVTAEMNSYSGMFINNIYFYCYPWSASNRSANPSGSRAWIIFGGSAQLPPGSHKNGLVSCPADKVGKGVRGRYGGYIDSLQFFCDDYNK